MALRPRRGGAPPELDVRQARSVALALLARKAWARVELVRRLARRGAPAPVAAAVVAELERQGHLDDRAFARGWAESRARGRGLGSIRLREELRGKGVAEPLVAQALAAAFAETDETAAARAAAGRRWPALAGGGPEAAARRLQSYLLRRGFPAGVVRRVVRETARVSREDGARD
jgi:regulatory protein